MCNFHEILSLHKITVAMHMSYLHLLTTVTANFVKEMLHSPFKKTVSKNINIKPSITYIQPSINVIANFTKFESMYL